MNQKACSYPQREQRKIEKLLNMRFPHSYKRMGIIGAICVLVVLFAYKYLGANELLVKDVCRTVMLLFLLVASMSKDAIEDEYISHIRAQSYMLAFVCATVYSIGLPLLSFGIDILLTKAMDGRTLNFDGTSAFEVMFMLICFQLLFFEKLKRLGRAE